MLETASVGMLTVGKAGLALVRQAARRPGLCISGPQLLQEGLEISMGLC